MAIPPYPLYFFSLRGYDTDAIPFYIRDAS